MSASQPPRLATWLLQRWGAGPRRESLLGDLIERYQQRQSPIWYWRQVLRAILVGAMRDVRAHKWLAARAIAASYVLVVLSELLAQTIYRSAGRVVWNGTVILPNPVLAIMFVSPVVIGWAIARFHPRHSSAMVLSCAAFWAVLFVLPQLV